MFNCLECSEYSKCIKPCERIEKELRKEGIYKASYIRKRKYREIPVGGINELDGVATKRATKLKYGRHPRYRQVD